MLDHQQYHVKAESKLEAKSLKISSDLLQMILSGTVTELSITDDKVLLP
jgi:hypothetical protein